MTKTVKKINKKIKKDLKSALSADVYNAKGEVVEQIDLPKEVFGEKVNEPLLAQAVRVYLANQKIGTHEVKTRGEVSGGGRKPWRQKGTGRARAGSIRAPHFRGGGIVFGPTSHTARLKLSKPMKKKALTAALSLKFKEGKIKVLLGNANFEPKTKKIGEILDMLLEKKTKTLLVLPGKMEKFQQAVRNLENIECQMVSDLNPYQILKQNYLIFLKEAVEKLKTRGA